MTVAISCNSCRIIHTVQAENGGHKLTIKQSGSFVQALCATWSTGGQSLIDWLVEYELSRKPAKLITQKVDDLVLDKMEDTGIEGAKDSSKPVGMRLPHTVRAF